MVRADRKAVIEEVGLDAEFILLASLPQRGVSGDGRVGGKRTIDGNIRQRFAENSEKMRVLAGIDRGRRRDTSFAEVVEDGCGGSADLPYPGQIDAVECIFVDVRPGPGPGAGQEQTVV